MKLQEYTCYGCGVRSEGTGLYTDGDPVKGFDRWYGLPLGWLFRLYDLGPNDALENGCHTPIMLVCSEACAQRFVRRGGIAAWRGNGPGARVCADCGAAVDPMQADRAHRRAGQVAWCEACDSKIKEEPHRPAGMSQAEPLSGFRVARAGFLFCGRCCSEIPREEAVHGVDFVAICRACASGAGAVPSGIEPSGDESAGTRR